jgi:hypothetical protein
MEPVRSGVDRRGERCRSTRAAWYLWTALALAGLSVGALGGCGGDDDGTSPASLTGELLPASEIPGFKVVREFEWDNPIDFVGEGLHLPESTPPSDAVEAFENTGFEAAAGEFLVKGEPFQGPGAAVDVVQLGSDDDAREALDYVRSEALKQPCFAVCSVEGREFSVSGIPGAKGVELTPLPEPPPDAPPPFESFSVGFTDGSRLYVVSLDGGPGQVEKGEAVSAAKALYDRATSEAAS